MYPLPTMRATSCPERVNIRTSTVMYAYVVIIISQSFDPFARIRRNAHYCARTRTHVYTTYTLFVFAIPRLVCYTRRAGYARTFNMSRACTASVVRDLFTFSILKADVITRTHLTRLYTDAVQLWTVSSVPAIII